MTMLLGYGTWSTFSPASLVEDEPARSVGEQDRWVPWPNQGKSMPRTCPIRGPEKGMVTIQLQAGHHSAEWFSALSGQCIRIPAVDVQAGGSSWTPPEAPENYGWALLLVNRHH